MSGEHPIPDLDRKGLREFALVTGGIVAGLFGVGFPWLLGRPWPLWPWLLLAALGTTGLAAPMALKPVYRAWMKLGLLLNRITAPLLLGILFFVVISPIGLLRRLKGNDAMERHFEANATSYRVPSHDKPRTHLERPF